MIARPFLILVIAPLDPGEAIAVSGLIPRLLHEIPNARFTIVGGPESAHLFADTPELADLITVPKYDGVGARLSLTGKLSKRTWGLILDLGGAGISGWLKRKRRAELKVSEVLDNRTLAVARILGFEDDPPAPFLYTNPELDAAADEALAGEGQILAMGPGAEWVGRVWPAERYGQVASQLMMVPGAPLVNGRIVAFGGEMDRDAINDSIFPLPRKRIISRPYAQELMTDYAWLKRCRLYIGGDNIWTQAAAAAGCPTLALFGPSDDHICAPFGPHVRVVRGPRDFETLRALDPEFSFQMSHLTDLTVETVLTAARGLLLKTKDPNA